jgi:hypothetical protein
MTGDDFVLERVIELVETFRVQARRWIRFVFTEFHKNMTSAVLESFNV